MVTPWLEKNPRAAKALKFGREQQFVINPNGIAELCDELKQCPRHTPTPLHLLPALAERLGLGEIRVKDESQRFGFGAFKALGGVIAVYNVLSGAVGEAYHFSTSISDTSWEGYDSVPRSVMRGYCVLVHETIVQWPEGPTHVFVQAGVGGLAAAVIGYLWAALPHRPTFVVVEPESADCWFQSNLLGKPALASGNADTVMGGLACREISPVTWPVVGEATDWFMTIEEDQVMPARRLLAHPMDGDPAIVSGPSGCAGMAGLTRVCTEEAAFKALKLDRRSR